jgi:hypothetical protein
MILTAGTPRFATNIFLMIFSIFPQNLSHTKGAPKRPPGQTPHGFPLVKLT